MLLRQPKPDADPCGPPEQEQQSCGDSNHHQEDGHACGDNAMGVPTVQWEVGSGGRKLGNGGRKLKKRQGMPKSNLWWIIITYDRTLGDHVADQVIDQLCGTEGNGRVGLGLLLLAFANRKRKCGV